MESQISLLNLGELHLKAAGILTLALAMRLLIRRMSAANRAGILLAGVIVTLLLPVTKFVKPLWSYQWAPPDRSAESSATVVTRAAPPSLSSPAVESQPSPQFNPPWYSKLDYRWGFLRVWLAGSLLFLTWRMGAWFRLRAMVAHSYRLNDQRACGIAETVANIAGVSPEVRVSKHCGVPLAMGILRPRVLIPEQALEWSEPRLRAALFHESGHLRRGDCLARWIADLACAFYWMNPMVWIVRHALVLEQEQACDNFVLCAGADSHDYASQLVEIVRSLKWIPNGSLAMAQPSTLETRVRAIVDDSCDRRPLSKPGKLAGIGLMILVLGVCAAAQLEKAQAKKPALAAAPANADLPEVSVQGYFVEISPGTKLPPVPYYKSSIDLARNDFAPDWSLTEEQFQAAMRALNTPKGVTLFSTPQGITRSGQRMIVEIVREFRYPSDWKRNTRTGAWEPAAFDKRNVGITLEVQPEVKPDGELDLKKLSVGIVAMHGFAPGDKAARIPSLREAVEGKLPSTKEIKPLSSPLFSRLGFEEEHSSIYPGEVVMISPLLLQPDGTRAKGESTLHIFIKCEIVRPEPKKLSKGKP